MLVVDITAINETEGHIIWEDNGLESDLKTSGDLFRHCRKEYGRCISSIYIDKKGGSTEKIGWLFEKRSEYEDVKETYLHHTWVTFTEYEKKGV